MEFNSDECQVLHFEMDLHGERESPGECDRAERSTSTSTFPECGIIGRLGRDGI